jgi:hypothetical protein
MGKRWDKFQRRASRKEEREHFGLAWSVFAAYWVAWAILLRSIHSTGWLVTIANVGVWAFFILGGFGVYLAFAVPMRWWPHHPQKPDEKKLQVIEGLFLLGMNLLEDWGKLTQMSLVAHIPGVSGQDRTQEYLTLSDERAKQLVEWITTSEARVNECLGMEEGGRYKMSPDLSGSEPGWSQGTIWVGLYQNIMCRLSWLRAWSQNQFDL